MSQTFCDDDDIEDAGQEEVQAKAISVSKEVDTKHKEDQKCTCSSHSYIAHSRQACRCDAKIRHFEYVTCPPGDPKYGVMAREYEQYCGNTNTKHSSEHPVVSGGSQRGGLRRVVRDVVSDPSSNGRVEHKYQRKYNTTTSVQSTKHPQ